MIKQKNSKLFKIFLADSEVENMSEMKVTKDTKDKSGNKIEERKFQIIEEIKERIKITDGEIIDIDGIRVQNNKGWLLIRASNTQNQITCRAEALNKDDLSFLINLIENQLEKSGVNFKFNLE